MAIELNTRQDFETLSRRLASTGHVVVPDIFAPGSAEQIHAELANEIPWELAVHTAKGPAAIDAKAVQAATSQQRFKLMDDVRQQAVKGFSFIYGRYDLIPGEPEHLTELRRLLASEEMLAFFRQMTDEQRIDRLDAHATMYQQSFFLKKHNDIYAGKNRLYAFVLGLTRNWQPDWGGLLHFLDENEEITGTIVPRFNTLCMFKVPQDHFVSMVTNYTTETRLAVTGWLFAPGDHRSAQDS